MNITIRQLEVFLALFDTRSFTAAATQRHMTQSAVSKVVAELEAQLGFALFDRTTRRVQPNAEAFEFHPFAEEIIATMRSAARSVAELADLQRGRVGIAASPMMVYGLLAPLIADYRARYPGVQFDLHELSTDETVASVLAGRVDFGLGAVDHQIAGADTQVAFEDSMFAVVRADHPIAGKKKVPWKTLARCEHISLRNVYTVRRTIDDIVARQGIALPSAIEVGTLTAALGLVRAGAGVVVLPGYAARIAQEWGLKACAIADIGTTVHRIHVIRRQKATLSIAARRFLDELQASAMNFAQPNRQS
ncbi:DNA-binding transcriptional regulator, LysR family [Variovorax sp. OK605]|jgi:LysR family carnitine catabolism transcriptional activator|uniref:LysR family transcriptional regulator n=1 Tax=Variovorax sp. OK605 TaxID=1855317 RepID=UPI0008E61E1E|nr:LysR family transcriptional regulator [Variovorax sp. OK605]SFQ09547.1 DNA-binding transcriptional regulator, LysR family [Variovorax sp. OK605]